MSVMSPWDSGDLGSTGVLGGGGTGGSGGGGRTSQATDPNAREFGTILQAVSEGPIQGLVNGLQSVFLDGTPIMGADGVTPNFKGIAFALVAGTNTQAMIPGFTDAESETPVNVKVAVSTGSVTRTISTAGISAIRVRVAIPALKIINATSGAESGASVRVKIERQSASYNGGAWEAVTLEGNGYIIGKFGSKYTRSYRIETPAAGPWSIRVTRLTPDHTSGSPDYTQDETWWDAYTEITDAKLRYPFTAVAALKVDAKQFQQIPQLTLELKGRQIQIPSNYNPTTRAYTGIWDGTFQTAWSDNPAWVWYDMASNTRYGAGTVLSASKLDKWALYAIGQQCDVLVSDGKGGTEPRFRCNLYLQNQEEAIKLLRDMASIFRGMVYAGSGLITAVQDQDAAPVAIFTNSNVKDGKFTYQGSARKSRHTAALVTWQDPANGYQNSVEYVEDQAAIARYGYNPIQTAALGATSQAQAHRQGLCTILSETMNTEVVNFSSGLEGITLRPGDIFATRDQFRAGDGRLGGRILAGATTTVIPLDAPVVLPAGTNTLAVKLADGTVHTSTVTTAAGTVSSLTISPALPAAPPALSQWALNPAFWRALSIKKADGIYYDITALEHDPTKYALVDGVTVTPGPSTPANLFVAPSALTLGDVVRIEKDKLVQSLTANWTGDATAIHYAEASQDYGEWQPMKVNALSASLDGITAGAWRVRVQALYPDGVSPWTTGTRTVATPTQTATDAADAAAAAAEALAKISDASADGIITDLERPGLKTLRATLALAVSAAQSQANGMGVGHSALDSAWSTFTANVDPILAATGNTAITKATWDGWWSTVYQEVQNLQGVLATTANNNAAYANTLARSSFNLIKNGNSEDPNPSGPEAEAVTYVPAYAYSGVNVRMVYGTGFPIFTANIPVNPGDQYFIQAYIRTSVQTGQMVVRFLDATGAQVGSDVGTGVAPASSAWARYQASATAPPGAVAMFIFGAAWGTGGWVMWDCLYACRKIAAGMLEADLAILGVIRSQNYVAGAYGSAPVGFKLSGYAFTTTFIDGTTDANCFFELQQNANFGGYKVQTVNDRIQPVNRIINPSFYRSLNGWTASGSVAYIASSYASGTGSAGISITSTYATATGDISQSFSAPKAMPGQTINLTLKTGFATTLNDGSSTSWIKAYLMNQTTGVETLLVTWNYSNNGQSLTWTARTVDISSYVSGGGDFSVRFDMQAAAATSSSQTITTLIDEVKIII